MVLVMSLLAAEGVLAVDSEIFITAVSVFGWRMDDLFKGGQWGGVTCSIVKEIAIRRNEMLGIA